MSNARNPIFDIMKGIGILLMLVGHIPPSYWLYHGIYTFHLPMFFLLAGYFANSGGGYQDGKIRTGITKSGRRLLLPLVFTTMGVICLSPLKFYMHHNWDAAINAGLSLLWGGGDTLETRWGSLGVGPIWFLVALFWTRLILDGIVIISRHFAKWQDELVLVASVVLSMGAVYVYSIWHVWPWCMMQGITAMQFVGIGWYVKTHPIPHWIKWICIICWPLAYMYGGIEMCDCAYVCYPLDVLGACGGTYCVYLLSKWISEHVGGVNTILQWCGLNSLVILCVHTLDRKTYLVRAIKGIMRLELTDGLNIAFHFMVVFFIAILICYVPKMKVLFGAKRIREL